MKIAVVGLGYVGLSNSLVLSFNNKVMAVDVIPEKVSMINRRVSPIVDADISECLTHAEINLQATLNLQEAVQDATYALIATPTNYDEVTKHFDTSAVDSVAQEITKINKNCWIVIKSTVPIGYLEGLYKKTGNPNLLFSPEFLREGHALYDNLYPSRIIVGHLNEATSAGVQKAREFAQLLAQGANKENVPCLIMKATEAESVKLFANTYLAARVAYFNELDSYCLENDLSSKNIIEGMSLDPRIGDFYNNPSFGYGGYCLPKDSKQLLSEFGTVKQSLISAIVSSNEIRKKILADEVIKKLPEGGKIGIYRLTMKSQSDNFRSAAIFDIMDILLAKNILVEIYEPMLSCDQYKGCVVVKDLSEFKSRADIILANRVDKELKDVYSKIFTRDVFGNN